MGDRSLSSCCTPAICRPKLQPRHRPRCLQPSVILEISPRKRRFMGSAGPSAPVRVGFLRFGPIPATDYRASGGGLAMVDKKWELIYFCIHRWSHIHDTPDSPAESSPRRGAKPSKFYPPLVGPFPLASVRGFFMAARILQNG